MSEPLLIDECLDRLTRGDVSARRELSARVYADLKKRAEALVRRVPPGAVSATTLMPPVD